MMCSEDIYMLTARRLNVCDSEMWKAQAIAAVQAINGETALIPVSERRIDDQEPELLFPLAILVGFQLARIANSRRFALRAWRLRIQSLPLQLDGGSPVA